MNVLAIGCHPDDMEISCSGTLAKCVKRGDKVTVCHVANGNMGHEIISPEELRVIRINEAKKAGRLFISKEPVSDFLKLFSDFKEKINGEKICFYIILQQEKEKNSFPTSRER